MWDFSIGQNGCERMMRGRIEVSKGQNTVQSSGNGRIGERECDDRVADCEKAVAKSLRM